VSDLDIKVTMDIRLKGFDFTSMEDVEKGLKEKIEELPVVVSAIKAGLGSGGCC